MLLLIPVSSCTKQASRVPASMGADASAATCPKGGWASAIVVDGEYQSGFDPTIAWNGVKGQPVLFDVAEESNSRPTQWLRVVERSRRGWGEARTLEAMVAGGMEAAVDDHGVIEVAFTRLNGDGGPLLGTLDPAGGWTIEGPIEPGLGFIQDRMSMLVGPAGEVVIAYGDQPTRTIKTATRRAGRWTIETVATRATLMRDHTLARDSHGGLHIIATDWASGELRLYSRDDAGEWPFVVAGQHAEGISLAIDTKDQLHLSWIDWQTNQLHHASGPAGGPFTTSDIPAGKLGNDTSIAVSTAGTVSISYDERECGDLHLARRRPGQDWTTEVVETRGQVGSDSSLVLDEAGCVHVAYGDSDAWDLKYATKCR